MFQKEVNNMLPCGFELDGFGHISYIGRLIGQIKVNQITWTNGRYDYFGYLRLVKLLKLVGYEVTSDF